jgi:hypothetical protein
MSDVSNIKNGTKLFLGPSSDTSNLDATETAIVSHIINYIDGQRVYLTAPLQYQYTIGDLITFYSHVYVYSSEGYGGDMTKGTLFKLDAYTWQTQEADTKTIYKKVTSARWCPMVGSVSSVIGYNLLFVRPYDSYMNWQSLFMNNVEGDSNTLFPVYDIIFDNYKIYKLQKKITLRQDDGDRTTYSWDKYNMQEDSLLPYNNNIVTYAEQNIVTGYNKNVDIKLQVRDQYFVGLRDVTVNFFKSGDTGALFDPLSGLVTTDLNGKAVIDYRSGSVYTGHTYITTRSTGGSLSNGSAYTWTSNNVVSYPDATPVYKTIYQGKEKSSVFGNLKQLWEDFRIIQIISPIEIYWVFPSIGIQGKSFFTTPGGDWGDSTDPVYGALYLNGSHVEEWLPMLYRGVNVQTDGPAYFDKGYGFELKWPWQIIENEEFLISNRITLLSEFDSDNKIKSLTDFLLYNKYEPGQGYPPFAIIVQPDETCNLQISQLKLSLHTHWVDNIAYDNLFTYVKINQFVFVEDAIPKFWSEKNPIDTNIWIRLRPFAFNLDESTLRMWVREYSYEGDSGYYEVTDSISLLNFDAGSGLLGIEVLYNPPIDFLYESLVFVRIEVYDVAYIPNFVYIEYWFKVTPDYKSPYLINLLPDRGDINVPVDTDIYFEIKDDGTGLNLDSLECLINSVRMDNNYLNIDEISPYHIKVTYNPPTNLYFDKSYKVAVKIQDTSPNENRMNDSYTFSTSESTGVLIIDPIPGVCKGGMNRFQDVSVKVLADGNGIDYSSIRMQVFDKDIHPRILPIVYRIS